MPRMLVLPPQTTSYNNPKAIVPPVSKSRAKFCLHPIRKSASQPPRLLALRRSQSSPVLCHHDRFFIVSPRSLPPPTRFFSSIWPILLNWVWRLLPFPSGFSLSAHPPWCLKEAVARTILVLALRHRLFSLPLLLTRFLLHLAGFPELGFQIVGVSVRVFSVGAYLHGGSKKLLQESSSSLCFYIVCPHSRGDSSYVLLAPLLQEFRNAGVERHCDVGRLMK